MPRRLAGLPPCATCRLAVYSERRGRSPDPVSSTGQALPSQQLQDFFQLLPHLLHDLRAERGFLLRPIAFQAQARAADGVALLVQQAADLAHHQHVVALVVAAVAAALDRYEAGKFGLPVAQYVRLHVAQLADFADGEIALGRDRRQFAIAARIKHAAPRWSTPRPGP